jgi:serine/threonine-protein kinase
MPIQSDSSTETRDVVARTKPNGIVWVVAVLAAGLAVGVAGWMIGRSGVKPVRTVRLSSVLGSGDYFGGSRWYPNIALSPDGSRVAYVATHNGVTQLYLRQIGEWDGQPLPGTFDANTPFFSPDGQWVGAVAGGKLVKIPVAGGAPVTVAQISYAVYGACWSADGWIYLGTEAPLGVVKVQAAGTVPLGATGLDKTKRENDHRFPEVLPGGKWLLYTARNADQRTFDSADILAMPLNRPGGKTLITGGTDAHFVAPGHLVFMRAGSLMAVPFDPVKAELKGTPVALVENVVEDPRVGAGQYSVSADGSLVYLQGGVTFGQRELVLVDHSGATRVLTARKQAYRDFALSPDGKFIATTIEGPTTGTWIYDIARDTETRFSTGPERGTPAWSADGKHILYFGYDKDGYSIFSTPLGGGKEEELADMEEAPSWPLFMSRDGSSLVFGSANASGRRATMLLSFGAGHPPIPSTLMTKAADIDWGQISPDGRSIAYNSDESGQPEVYVVTYPKLESKVKVSAAGGRHPQWSLDGRELYYRENATAQDPRPLSQRVKLMAVPVETSPAFKAGTPHMLFQGPYFDSAHDYALTPDGKGFILIRESQPALAPGELKVVLHWNEELKRRLPAN